MGPLRRSKNPVYVFSSWVRRQPPKIKGFLVVIRGSVSLLFSKLVVHDHDNLFVVAEAILALGIFVLIYKLMKEKICVGNSKIFLFNFLYSLQHFRV
jgi:hypothetical protein